MELITFGTGHGKTELGRDCSASLLTVGGASYLFDCGCNVESKMANMGLCPGEIQSVFITHMHEDHAGSLSSLIKRFVSYQGRFGTVFLPEQQGIEGIKGWLSALHLEPKEDKITFRLTAPGVIYRDEHVTVTAIANDHMADEKAPSYSYLVESCDKKIIFTGDLSFDLHDYPAMIFEEELDAVISELTHFKIQDYFDFLAKSRTKKLIFNHVHPRNIDSARELVGAFPFPAYIAEDGMTFTL